MVTRCIIHAFCQKVKTLTGKGGNPRQLKVKAQPTRHIVGGFQKDVLLLPEGEMVRAEQQKDLSTLTGTKSPHGILFGAAGDRRGRGISPHSRKKFGVPEGNSGLWRASSASAAVMMAMEHPPTGRCLWGPRLFYCAGQVMPRHQGFAPLRKTLDRAERRAPGVGGGLLHGRKKSGVPEGNSGRWRAVRPARR